MTDINTAALRASLERRGVIGALRTYDLCDALDAARAELKVVKDFKDYMLAHDPGPFVTELEERAEAALDVAYVDVLLAKIGELSHALDAARIERDFFRTQSEQDQDRRRAAEALRPYPFTGDTP